jgi:hypothetical protein
MFNKLNNDVWLIMLSMFIYMPFIFIMSDFKVLIGLFSVAFVVFLKKNDFFEFLNVVRLIKNRTDNKQAITFSSMLVRLTFIVNILVLSFMYFNKEAIETNYSSMAFSLAIVSQAIINCLMLYIFIPVILVGWNGALAKYSLSIYEIERIYSVEKDDSVRLNTNEFTGKNKFIINTAYSFKFEGDFIMYKNMKLKIANSVDYCKVIGKKLNEFTHDDFVLLEMYQL